ncbi:hypothetical protein MYSI104531_12950 [Mycobacterium simiae]
MRYGGAPGGAGLSIFSAFDGDAGGAVLGASPTPAGHHGGAVGAVVQRHVDFGGRDGPGGPAQAGEQQGAARRGHVGATGRGGQDQGAVGQLLFGPAPERFHQMMGAAIALEIARVRGPAGAVRNGAVDIAGHRRALAARPAAGQIAAPHEISQRRRGHIAGLRCGIGGVNQRHVFGRGGQFGDQLGRNQSLRAELVARRAALAGHGGLLGDHVDDQRSGRALGASRALGAPTPAPQPIRPGRERAQRIRPALLAGARILRTDGGRHRVQARIQRGSIRTEHHALDAGQAVAHLTDPHLPARRAVTASTHRIRVGPGHHLVHLRRQPGGGQRGPARHRGRQLCVHDRQHVGVGEQVGAIHQRLHHPKVDVPGSEYLRHAWQPLA